MRSVVAGIMCSTITLAIGQSSRGGEPCAIRAPAAANSMSLRTGRRLESLRRRLISLVEPELLPLSVRTG